MRNTMSSFLVQYRVQIIHSDSKQTFSRQTKDHNDIRLTSSQVSIGELSVLLSMETSSARNEEETK